MKIIGTRLIRGSYGSNFKFDDEGNEVEKKAVVKRTTRGRPKKYEVSEGRELIVPDELYKWCLDRHFLTPNP